MEKIEPRTTTDLGKIILTNGHEYNPETVYEKNTFVLYQNSTYLSLQTVSGVDPSNDLVNWQLMAKGFAGDDFVAENFVFVNREDDESDPAREPLIDADALGGNKPDFYAPQHEISDAFSTEKDYAIGDYCIYLNSLYRFTTAKSAGAWDGAAVVPVTIAQEMQDFSTRIESINGNYVTIANKIRGLAGTDISVQENGQVYLFFGVDTKNCMVINFDSRGINFRHRDNGVDTRIWSITKD